MSVAALTLSATGIAAAATNGFGTGTVGQDHGKGILLPSNQTVRPIGDRHLVTNGKLIGSSLSPDGKHVAASTAGRGVALTILDASSGKIVQQAGTAASADIHLDSGHVGQDGPVYSPDGSSLWLPQVHQILRFPVKPDGTVGAPTPIRLPDAGGKAALPSGMAFSKDGSKLYVALNGQNRLGIIDTASGKLASTVPVGNAPRQVALAGGKAYVSNEGGRPAKPGDFTLDSYGTNIVANPKTGNATTGTVSVVDVGSKHTKSVDVGLHPTTLQRHGDALFVTNTGSDTVSVIDTKSGAVTQTFNTSPLPGIKAGYHPNAVAMPDANHLLVSLGRANALAVYRYDGPKAPVSYLGLLPTDYYPSDVAFDKALGKVVVTNERGIGSRGPGRTIDKGPGTKPATGHNTHDVTGSVTEFTMPDDTQLARYTQEVFQNNRWEHLLAHQAKPDPNAKPQPVPNHLGEPSPIKHVFLIVRENRSYDQVFGDMKKGNGDPSLTQFGRKVTPNSHALAKRYTLFDNAYDIGTNSAEGHNWLMQADANDYVESQFGEYVRSYGSPGDALGHQRDGFLWNAVARAGKSTKVFGEYNQYFTAPSPSKGGPTWQDWYRDSQIMEGKAQGPMPVPTDKYKTYSPIPSLNKITDHAYPKFNLTVPDQYRTDIWLRSFRKAEKTGKLANLNLIWLPDNHTSGAKSGNPNPIAQVADNDLALGRMVDTITHSKFWKHSAIFVVQDDTQNGVDHVDGHRGPLEIISPYAKQGKVDSHYYTQLNVIRTIEQILGAAPMNQKDRAAVPMRRAFTDHPDSTPYTVKQNNIPLTYGLQPSGKQAGSRSGGDSKASPSTASSNATAAGPQVPAAHRAVAAQWTAWSNHQRFTGPHAAPDQANPAQFNRLTWYLTHHWRSPYPGDRKILAPNC